VPAAACFDSATARRTHRGELRLLDNLTSVFRLLFSVFCFEIGFIFPWPENGKFLIFFLYQRALAVLRTWRSR
jgi:hypothetical protein